MNKIVNKSNEIQKINVLTICQSQSLEHLLKSTIVNHNLIPSNTNSITDAYKKIDNFIKYIFVDISFFNNDSCKDFFEKTKNNDIKVIFLLNKKNELKSFEKYTIFNYIIKDKDFFRNLENILENIKEFERHKDKKLLIIDDSVVIREQLKDTFENKNYNVKLASNISDALVILKKYPIDLILLDIELKGENGIEFLRKYKDLIINELNIPVVMISSTVNSKNMKASLDAGAVDILRKPYVIEEIILKVDLWIDYRRKQEKIIQSTKLLNEYKDMVDTSFIVSKADNKGLITYVNDAFCKISGYSRDELIGHNHNIIKHPDTSKKVYENLWNTISVLKKTWKGKIKNKKKDGSYFWVESLIKPILDDNGEIMEFIGIKKDITDQENAKEFFKSKFKGSIKDLNRSIKLSNEYEKAIDAASIVSRTDLEGRIIYVNDAFCEISGYSKDELIGASHNIVRHPDTPSIVFKQMWDELKNGNIFKGIIKNKSKSNHDYWIDTTIVPIKNEFDKVVEYMAIRKDVSELFKLNEEIELTQKEVIRKMGEIGETRSNETGNHVKRVAKYSRLFALYYGLNQDEIDTLFTASPMHDIGKVGIPDAILNKPDKLTIEEFEVMKTHTLIGYNILKDSRREVLKAAAIVSKEHHEKWNGKGYPNGLKGEEIHIYGRITAIADVFDALGSKRHYKNAWSDEKIFDLIRSESGEHFDPKLVDIFFKHKKNFLSIRDRYTD